MRAISRSPDRLDGKFDVPAAFFAGALQIFGFSHGNGSHGLNPLRGLSASLKLGFLLVGKTNVLCPSPTVSLTATAKWLLVLLSYCVFR
jgi:hypothetical protein